MRCCSRVVLGAVERRAWALWKPEERAPRVDARVASCLNMTAEYRTSGGGRGGAARCMGGGGGEGWVRMEMVCRWKRLASVLLSCRWCCCWLAPAFPRRLAGLRAASFGGGFGPSNQRHREHQLQAYTTYNQSILTEGYITDYRVAVYRVHQGSSYSHLTFTSDGYTWEVSRQYHNGESFVAGNTRAM